MRVIILAAGESKRFQEEQYIVPKPFIMIDWRGFVHSMLGHILNTVPAQFESIAVGIPGGWMNEAVSISSIPTYYEIQSKGPADTTFQVLKHVQPDDTLIMDVDVLNWTNDLYRLSKLPCCGVLTSWSANPSFSYVNQLGPFHTIAEKQRISEDAVRGAYYVPGGSRAKFMESLEKAILRAREPFISHAFNVLDDEKFALTTTYTPIEWGTPRDIRISGAHIITEKGKLNVHNRRN